MHKSLQFRNLCSRCHFVFFCWWKLRDFVENSITILKYKVQKDKCYCLIQSVMNLYPPPPIARHPLVGRYLLSVEASRSRSNTPRSVGLFETSDHPDAETSLPDNSQHLQEWDIHAPGGVSNPESQQTSGHRHMTYTTWPLGSAVEPILYFNGIVLEEFPLGMVHLLAQRIHRQLSTRSASQETVTTENFPMTV